MAKGDVIDVLIAEAIGEGDEGLAAVAWTILNRAAETGRTPAQVVSDPGDYTGANSPGSATKKAMKDPKVRARVERVWNQVQSGSIPDPTGGATHYWAPNGMKGGKAPYWAKSEMSAAGRLQIGNHVFLPKQTPNSALAAINAVAPTPMPSRPVALGYAQNTRTPAVTAPSVPPGMRALSDSNAAFGVLPFSKTFDPSVYPLEGQGINLWARDRSGNADALIAAANTPRATVPRVPSPQMTAARTPSAPARGVGTSYLAPPTKVATYKVDMNGNPIIPQASEPLPSERVVPPSVPKLMAQANAAAAVAPKMATLTPMVAAAPPVAPAPRTKPLFPATVAPTGIYAAAPAPIPAVLPTDARLPKGDPALENFKRGQDIAMALYPRPATSATAAISAATAPRVMPRMLPTAMIAARAPMMAAPISTPRPPARMPLTTAVPAPQVSAPPPQSNWTTASTAAALGVDPDHPAAIIAARTWK